MKLSPTLKCLAVSLTAVAVLSACGGGGGSATVPTAGTIQNSVTPSAPTSATAGTSLTVTADAIANFSPVASQTWAVTQLSGPAAPTAPNFADPSCATATVTVGLAATGSSPGQNGTAHCQTSLVIAASTPASQWSVTNTAKTAAGASTASFVLNVSAATPLDKHFTVVVPSLAQTFMTGATATLSAAYSVGADAQLGVPVTYEWSQVSGPALALAGANTSSVSFNAAAAGNYVLQIKESTTIDGVVVTSTGAVVATIETPAVYNQYQVSAGPLQTVTTGSTVSLAGAVTGTTPTAGLTYQWTQLSGPSVILFGATSLTPQFTATTAGTYAFQLTSTSGDAVPQVISAQTQVTVATPVVNAPFFSVSAGDAQTVALNATTFLKGQVAAGVPAPTNLTYSWTQTGGPAVVLANPSAPTASFIPTAAGAYTFTFSASSAGVTESSTAVVTVAPAPAGYFAVNAGTIQSVNINTPVSLAGTVTGTVAAQNPSYQWTQTSGPAATLVQANGLTAQFVPATAGTYAFTLTVTRTDGVAGVQTAQTVVVVSDPSTQVFGIFAGNAQIVAITKPVILQGTLAASATLAPNVVYQWTQVSGTTVTLSNANTLTASFVAPATGLYSFQLSATAGGVTESATTTVQVLTTAP